MSAENLRVWNEVEKTDPRYTKTVSIGRKFTAIDPEYQIMRATEVFGPVGEGWGYSVEHSYLEIVDHRMLCFADVTVWHGSRENVYGPVRGTQMLVVVKPDGSGHVDKDAPKKATTDALTKALSHLGVSADVFLGKFDQVDYVTDTLAEFEEKDAVNEAVAKGVEVITPDQAKELKKAITGAGMTVKDFCHAAKIKTLVALSSDKFEGAINWLGSKGGDNVTA